MTKTAGNIARCYVTCIYGPFFFCSYRHDKGEKLGVNVFLCVYVYGYMHAPHKIMSEW